MKQASQISFGDSFYSYNIKTKKIECIGKVLIIEREYFINDYKFYLDSGKCILMKFTHYYGKTDDYESVVFSSSDAIELESIEAIIYHSLIKQKRV